MIVVKKRFVARSSLASAGKLALMVAGGLAICASLEAQTVFSTGLLNPAKIIFGPSGTLIVSEAGATPNSGRVSIVSSSGVRRTLIDGLPSGLSNGGRDPDGPTGLVLEGNTLYVVIGEGDELSAGATPGTMTPNPIGPASPILNSILKFTFSQPVDLTTAPLVLKTADHSALAEGDSAALEDGAGGKATAILLSTFRHRADPALVYRNSHPYALTKWTSDSNLLYLANAGLNSIVQIDSQTGRSRTVVKFPPQPNRGTIGPPVTDAVPDNIRVFGDKLLVNLLTGFPFAAGNSKVVLVDPVSGTTEVLLDNLTMGIDFAWRARFFGRLQYYVLEYSANQLAGAPGRLKLFEAGEAKVLLDNLKGPTSMALDAQAGKLYISTRGDGNILQFDLGN